MKKYIFYLIPIIAMVLLFSACVSGPSSAVPSTWSPSSQQTGLWVNGEGKVTYVPDIAVLTLGIESQEKSVSLAQNAARDAMSRILEALKSKGVAEKDIRTQSFNNG
jgi:uncharacterized protein